VHHHQGVLPLYQSYLPVKIQILAFSFGITEELSDDDDDDDDALLHRNM